MPTIVPIYAAILAFIFIFLSVRVIRMRQATRIGIGAGGHRCLERCIGIQILPNMSRSRSSSSPSWKCRASRPG